MSALGAEVVTLAGRFAALPNRVLAREIERQGGTVRRGLSQQTTLLAVGRHSAPLLADGRLQARLARAEEYGARCIGESALLRWLGLLPPAAPVHAALRLEELPEKAGLAPGAGPPARAVRPDPAAGRRLQLPRSGRGARDRAARRDRPRARRDHHERGRGRRRAAGRRRPSARPPQAGLRRAGPARAAHRRAPRRARRPAAAAARQSRQPVGRRDLRGGRGGRAAGRSGVRRGALPALHEPRSRRSDRALQPRQRAARAGPRGRGQVLSAARGRDRSGASPMAGTTSASCSRPRAARTSRAPISSTPRPPIPTTPIRSTASPSCISRPASWPRPRGSGSATSSSTRTANGAGSRAGA